MITKLTYLPELKRDELTEITRLIVEEMQPAMVILFGSYARNTWAEEVTQEDGINLLFKSDYDILVVTTRDLNHIANTKWQKVQQKLKSRKYSTALSLIQHSAGYINNELKAGGYFFSDVIKEGKVIYTSGVDILGKPGNVDPVEVKKRAKEEFERWMENGKVFLKGFNFYFNENDLKHSAFLLHQATESFYTAYLLVFTGYKGKVHDIEELGTQIARIHPEFASIFPMDSKFHIESFHKLKRAYIDARYKKDYIITKEELTYLRERAEVLSGLVDRVCRERLNA